jgi:hypothetical protein
VPLRLVPHERLVLGRRVRDLAGVRVRVRVRGRVRVRVRVRVRGRIRVSVRDHARDGGGRGGERGVEALHRLLRLPAAQRLLALDLGGKPLPHRRCRASSRLLEPLGRGFDGAVETAGADGAHGAVRSTQDDVPVGALGHAGRRLDL